MQFGMYKNVSSLYGEGYILCGERASFVGKGPSSVEEEVTCAILLV